MNFSAIITAGGSSSRFGKTNKLLEKIHDKEVIKYSVEAFLNIAKINEIVICANPAIIDILKDFFEQESKIRIIEGGKTRQQSVFNGLLTLQNSDYVLIHDGARPMIDVETIKKAMQEVQTKKALTVATKTVDTIKHVDGDLKIIKTIERSSLYNTQTPQVFEYELIKDAHEKLKDKDFTDDAGMLEYLGKNVYIVEGDYKNIKITTQNDINIAEIYLNKTKCEDNL
jgi:2-C-methyl-D-erythritol 4-phosphate cytidylyltransferase